MTPDLELQLRQVAREVYDKTRAGNPSKLPHADTEAGKAKLESLFEVIAKPFRIAGKG